MPQALGLPATQDGRGAPRTRSSTRTTWRARPWAHRPARRARGWHGSRHTSGADRLGTTTTVEPPAGGHDASVPRTGVVRHALRRQPSHAPATLAPHLFKLAKVEHRGPLQRWPVLHSVPIAHRRLPIKPPVIRDVLEEDALHLAGELSPVLRLKRLALLGKQRVKGRVAIVAQVERRLAHQSGVVTNGVSLSQTNLSY